MNSFQTKILKIFIIKSRINILYCYYLGALKQAASCNIDILSPYKVHFYTSSRHWATRGFVVTFLMKSNIHSPFLALFWSPPTPEKNIWLFSCQMLQFLHQLVSNLVFLLFWCWAGNVQWVYQRFFSLKTAARCCGLMIIFCRFVTTIPFTYTQSMAHCYYKNIDQSSFNSEMTTLRQQVYQQFNTMKLFGINSSILPITCQKLVEKYPSQVL